MHLTIVSYNNVVLQNRALFVYQNKMIQFLSNYENLCKYSMMWWNLDNRNATMIALYIVLYDSEF